MPGCPGTCLTNHTHQPPLEMDNDDARKIIDFPTSVMGRRKYQSPGGSK
jgi:hypothetical protein